MSVEYLERTLHRDVSESDDDLAQHESVQSVSGEIATMLMEIESAAELYPLTSGCDADISLSGVLGLPRQVARVRDDLERVRRRFGETRLAFDAFVKGRSAISGIIEMRKVCNPPCQI